MKNNLYRGTLAFIFIISVMCIPSANFAAELSQVEEIPEGGKATLTFAAPLLTMTEIPFTVELVGGTGMVFSDAAVNLRLVMPAMAMPLNNPKALWVDGAYHGTAVFTMAGEWQAIMIIQRPGHDMLDLTFDLGEVQMK